MSMTSRILSRGYKDLPAVGRAAAQNTDVWGRTPVAGSRDMLKAYETYPWLRGFVGQISMDCAEIPWRVFRPVGMENHPGRKAATRALRRMQRAAPDAFLRYVAAGKSSQDLVEEYHPFIDLLEKPNSVMDGWTMMAVMVGHWELLGEWFLVMDLTSNGTPVALYPTPPTWVRKLPTVEEPYYEVHTPGGKIWQIDERNMVSARAPSLANPFGRGVGTAMSMADELATDEHAAKYTRSWFQNKAMPSFLIGVEGATPEELRTAKRNFQRGLTGYANAYKSHWHSGNIQLHQLSHTLREMDFTGLRTHERDMFRQMFGIPPEIVGIVENSNRSTIDAAEYMYTRRVLVKRLEPIRRAFQDQVMPLYGVPYLLCYDSPVPEDKEFKLETAKAAPGAVKVDEWREMMGLPKLPNGEGEKLYEPDKYTSDVDKEEDQKDEPESSDDESAD